MVEFVEGQGKSHLSAAKCIEVREEIRKTTTVAGKWKFSETHPARVVRQE